MATKSANIYARIEPEVKEQAESILNALGIPISSAINMFYKQIIIREGIPFDLTITPKRLLDIQSLTKEELHKELEKGYKDILEGRTKPAEQVFAQLKEKYKL